MSLYVIVQYCPGPIFLDSREQIIAYWKVQGVFFVYVYPFGVIYEIRGDQKIIETVIKKKKLRKAEKPNQNYKMSFLIDQDLLLDLELVIGRDLALALLLGCDLDLDLRLGDTEYRG